MTIRTCLPNQERDAINIFVYYTVTTRRGLRVIFFFNKEFKNDCFLAADK